MVAYVAHVSLRNIFQLLNEEHMKGQRSYFLPQTCRLTLKELQQLDSSVCDLP